MKRSLTNFMCACIRCMRFKSDNENLINIETKHTKRKCANLLQMELFFFYINKLHSVYMHVYAFDKFVIEVKPNAESEMNG
jgi:hypothetical protein